jgi:transcriptional regulator with XRE-family HTH domain
VTLGERIAQLRKVQGISQERLANRAGIRRESVTRLEREDQLSVQLRTAIRIARAFGMTLDELLKGVDTDSPAAATL